MAPPSRFLARKSPLQPVPVRRPARGALRGLPDVKKGRAGPGPAPGVSAARHDQEDVKGPSRLSIRWTGTGDFGDSWVDMKRRLKPLPKTRAEHPWRIRRESDDDVADREDPILSLGARLAEPAESP